MSVSSTILFIGFLIFSSNYSDIEKNYDCLYELKYPKKEIFQKLYTKYLKNNRIQYKLILSGKDCENNLIGTVEMNVNADPEINEDESGEAYASTEYYFENKEYYFGISISEDKKKAKVSYSSYDGEKEKCSFILDKIMNSK